MVRQIHFAFNAEVHHERAAAVALGIKRCILECARAERVGDQVLQGPRGIGIHYHMVVAILGAIDYYAAGFVALEQDAFHWFAAADARAHFCGRISHRLRQRVAAADGVPDAVLVFDEWQN